jgi:hypothetical protein
VASPEQEHGRHPSEDEVGRFLADLEAWREQAGESDFDLWASLAAINRSIAQLTSAADSVLRRGRLAATPFR